MLIHMVQPIPAKNQQAVVKCLNRMEASNQLNCVLANTDDISCKFCIVPKELRRQFPMTLTHYTDIFAKVVQDILNEHYMQHSCLEDHLYIAVEGT